MNFALVFILLMFIFISYFLYDLRIFSPPMLLVGGFIISTIILVFNQKYFNYQLSEKTFLIITGSILCYFLGDLFGRFVIYNIRLKKRHCNLKRNNLFDFNDVRPFYVYKHKKIMILFMLISILALFFQFKHLRTIGFQVTDSHGFSTILSSGGEVRSYITHYSIDRNYFEVLIVKAVLPISYISYFLYLYNRITLKKVKGNKFLLVFPVIHFFSELLTTNRIGMTYILLYILNCYLIMSSIRNKWSRKNNKRVIKSAIMSVVVVFSVFRFSGFLTQRGIEVDFLNQISDYTAAALLALDQGLAGNVGVIARAEDLFRGLLKLTDFIGITNTVYMSTNAGFVFWDNGSTNIYTSIYAYVSAFGYIGNFIVFFFFGTFYGSLFKHIMIDKSTPFRIIATSWLLGALPLTCIADRFFTQYLVVNVFVQFVFLYVLSKYINRFLNASHPKG